MANFYYDIFQQVEQRALPREGALDLLRLYQRSGCIDEAGAVHWLRKQRLDEGKRILLYCVLTGREFFLADHVVQGGRMLPAVSYLELARAAIQASGFEARSGFRLENISFERPFALENEAGRLLVVELTAGAGDALRFTLASTSLSLMDAAKKLETRELEGDGPTRVADLVVHCTGGYVPEPLDAPPANRLVETRALQEFDGEACYRFMATKGFGYGETQRALRKVELQSERQLLAHLALPQGLASSLQHMVLHPSLCDSALQAAIGFFMADAHSADLAAGLPFAIDQVRVFGACELTMSARVIRPASASGATTRLDVELYNAEGRICVVLEGVTSRATSSGRARNDELLLAQPVWHPEAITVKASPAHPAAHHRIVLLGDFRFRDTEPRTEYLVRALKAHWPTGVRLPEIDGFQFASEGLIEDFTRQGLRLKSYLQEALSAPRNPEQGNVILHVVVDGASPFSQGAHAVLLCVAKEYPELIPRVVAWHASSSITEMAKALADEAIYGDADYVRYAPARAIKRWEALPTAAPVPAHGWRDAGRYLISGGLGHLGLAFAEDIAKKAASPCIVLMGRRPLHALGDAEQQRIQSLREAGAEVVYCNVDVADEAAVKDRIGAIERDHGPLHGVLHAAGVVEDGSFADKTADAWERVLRPKVHGAVNLDQATRHMPLDFFVLFSSGSAIFGNAGQSDYAAANAFMAEYAARRHVDVAEGRARGQSLCIHWPLWDGGMKLPASRAERMYRETGMRPMQAALGIEGLHRSLAASCTELLVAAGDKDKLAQHLAPPASPVREPDPPPRDDAKIRNGAKRHLQQVVAGVLKLSMQQLRTDQTLDQYGIDSVDMMKMIRELEKTFGALPKTLFFQYTTVDELADYFAAHHASSFEEGVERETVAAAPSKAPSKAEPARAPSRVSQPSPERGGSDVAIIGLSGRYPGAKDVVEFWDNLANGVDAVTEIPKERWDWKAFFRSEGGHAQGAHASKWGGFIDGVDEFDPLFFNIAPSEAEILDPQERLFLQYAWMALEDAGYCRRALSRTSKDVGVYVGVMYSEYIQCADNDPERLVGSSYASIANRVSYVLDLRGPSMAIDTMCSSSLTCLYLACQELASGGIGMALVGGVNLNLHPNKYHMLSRGRFISPRGRCHSFGAEGDGYIPSEGVGAMCIKLLADAERDGDPIHAVIKGIAINHGGKGQGYSVPQPQRQQEVVLRALKRARVDARSVTYVEAHGTGTSLGDPIEVAGLSEAFSRDTEEKQYCALGSVKSNIGHCEAAAGMAAVTKVIGQMRVGELFPSLHAQSPNPHIDFANSPFVLVRERRAWQAPSQTRVAGISSFGAGGSNAHVILEEYADPRPASPGAPDGVEGPFLVPLSARTPEQRVQQARQLLDYLEGDAPADLASIAYTLQVGREPWEERLAFLAHGREELRELLEGYLAGRPDERRVFSGSRSATGNKLLPLLVQDRDIHEVTDAWFAKRKYAELLTVWVEGVDLDWDRWHTDSEAGRATSKPRKVHLPTYPFAKERHWLPELQTAAVGAGSARARLGFMVPAWEPLPAAVAGEKAAPSDAHIFLCAGTAEQTRALARSWPRERCQLLTSDASAIDQAFTDIALQLFDALQRLLSGSPKAPVRVQVVVVGQGTERLLSALEAMVRSVALEHPALKGQIVQVECEPGEDDADQLRAHVERSAAHPDVSLIRYRNASPLQRGWHEVPEAKVDEVPWRENGVYLITGGSGALGSLLAQQLGMDTPSLKLILVGRRSASELAGTSAGVLLEQMRARGIHVDYRSADITQLEVCERLVAGIEQEYGPIHGIFHAAGVARDGIAARKTQEEFKAVLSPKVSGAVNLDLATRHRKLDFFVLYSSLSGAMGNAGQSDYATANAFMDGYAAYRNQQCTAGACHGRTISINWPWWQSEGMSLNEHAERVLREQVGMQPLGIEQGMRALRVALALGHEQLLVTYGDTEKMHRAMATGSRLSVEDAVEATNDGEPAADGEGSLVARVTDQLRQLLGRLCKLSPQRIDPRASLENYGVDSVKVLHLQQGLVEFFADVSTAMLYEHATLASLAEYLVAQHPAESRRYTGNKKLETAEVATIPRRVVTSPPPAPTLPVQTGDGLVAIIGMAGRYPKAANLDEYWQNLAAGRDCVDVIPGERWPLEGFFLADKDEASQKGKSYCKWGGFVDGFADFDPQFFSIAPREAYLMDPQERLFLQCAWDALEDAGCSKEALTTQYRKRVGVFVGATKTGFELYGPEFWRNDKAFLPRTSFGSIANRVSYCLDLAGPSLAIDTMCSSSLVAVHEACENMQRGSCELAIAGGVNLYLHPANYISLCSGHMLSTEGRCRSFGAGGDGFVPGEGVGAVILKPLAHAQRDGDTIHAVIRASGINHAGKTHGYMVPSPASQYALIHETLAKAGCDAASISYLEAHGTGTALGDPIEFRGIARAFGAGAAHGQRLAIGSVKSNIGHLEAAAGIAALTKVVLQLRHRKLVPTLHSRETNPEVDLAGSRFYLPYELQDWLPDSTGASPLRAGISSFGAGGVNAHLIVEEYPETRVAGARETADARSMFVVSARNADRLDAYLDRLIDFLSRGEARLVDLCFVLQTGRSAMTERCGFVCDTTSELLAALRAHRQGQNVPGFYRQRVAEGAPAEAWQGLHAEGNFERIVQSWVQGAEVPWEDFYASLPRDRRPRKIRIPSYPFKQQRFWLDTLASHLVLDAPSRKPEIAKEASPSPVLLPETPSARIPIRLPVPGPFIAAPSGRRGTKIILRDPAEFASVSVAGAVSGPPMALTVDEKNASLAHVHLTSERPASELVAQLTALFQSSVSASPSATSVVVLHGPSTGLHQAVSGLAGEAVDGLVESMRHSPWIIVSAFHGDAVGLGWLLGAASDLLIVNAASRYGCDIAPTGSSALARDFAQARFGRRPGVNALPESEIAAQVAATTESLLNAAGRAGSLLKAHWQKLFFADVDASNHAAWPILAAPSAGPSHDVSSEVAAAHALDLGRPVPLPHSCIELFLNDRGIATLRLHDRTTKNAFTPELVVAMEAAVQWVEKTDACKVLILTGYDNYFASGGTQDGLRAIQQGKAKFTDARLYELPLKCPVPVMAAMQGHAIGAGWSMGLFCDTVFFAEQSVYHCPYISYGFTPGAGSTLVFPMRLGLDLGREILLSARPYKGSELHQRLPGLSVHPRNEVLARAHAAAEQWAARASREALIREKQQRLGLLGRQLPTVVREELAMHEKTFYHNPAVAKLIDHSYGLGTNGVSKEAVPAAAPPADNGARGHLGSVLRTTLADELQLGSDDLDEHASFVDLGLDSVTAVTWTRKLQQQFALELSPTQIYEYANLASLLEYFLRHANTANGVAPASPPLAAPAPVSAPAPASSPPDASEAVARVVLQTLAGELQLDANDLDAQASFVDLGLDSVTAVTWTRKLNQQLSTDLSATQLYEYSNLAALTAYLGGRAAIPAAPEPPPALETHTEEPPRARTDMAIIGMAGRFPGAADINEFWCNLREGRDGIREVPESRWSLEQFYHPDPHAKGKTNCRWIGLLDDADSFDAEFFAISPREAENMDPQQRVFMENCWHAIEHAGYDPFSLAGQHCGIFVGCATGDYADLCPRDEAGAQAFMGGASSILSARMPYFLNLDGPCLAIDTACSSALVAVNEACNSLLLGNCDMAIAGGVCVMAGPTIHILSSKAGMLSPQGRCRTFDNEANGFVPGEGVGTVVIRRLADAEAAGDTIYGVIRGWGTNQDGKTNGITAPNPAAQRRLASEIYRRYGIDPKQIGMAEAHGTGTKLGDPIEVRALTEAFHEFGAGTGYCALGSVKSNIGHLALAAGIAGLIKVLVSIQHRQIPPTLHCHQVNEHIDLDASPFYIPHEARAWTAPAAGARMACVSSFGFSGTNAHLVVEEYIPRTSANAHVGDERSHLVVLSARRPEQLKLAAERLRAHVIAQREAGNAPRLADIAYTLQTGRAHFRRRLAIVASSLEELIERLDPSSPRSATYEGTAAPSKDPERSTRIRQALAAGDLAHAATLWVAGGDLQVDGSVYQGIGPRRIALPGYAFVRQRHWFGTTNPLAEAPAPKPAEPRKQSKRIAVVGAGPAGLVMAKSLLEEGHTPVVFERQSDLGGVWLLRPEDKQAGAYKKTRFQTSKHTSVFSDFSGPPGEGHFFSAADMHRYLSAYAEQFQLSPHIHYRTEVSEVAPHGERWKVTTVRDGVTHTDIYDGVALCQGLYWKPWRPTFPGIARFRGQTMHSGAYFDEECLRGKRVLVVGNGISGMDIAEEATKSASSVHWVMRRPKFIMPRMTGFVPNDFQSPAALLVEGDPAQMLERIQHSMPDYHRQYQRSGLLPNLEDFRKLPVVQINDGIVQMVANGKVDAIIDEIDEFTAQGCRFKNSGRELDVDVVVFCTGYTMDEYLDYLPGVSMRKDFSMGIYHRDNPTLVSTSCPLPVAYSGTFFFPEMVARWYARIMSGRCSLQDSERNYRLDGTHGAINGPIASVLFGLKLGLLPDPKREFKEFWRLVNLPSFPPIYRLRGEHSDPEAGRRLQDLSKRNLTGGKQAAALETVKYRILAGFDGETLRDLLKRGEIEERDVQNAGKHTARAITLDWSSQYILRGQAAVEGAADGEEKAFYRRLLGQVKAGQLDMQGLLKALTVQEDSHEQRIQPRI